MISFLLRYLMLYLYIFVIFIQTSTCQKNKQINYKKLVIEDDRLCSAVTNRHIALTKHEYSSLYVTQTISKDHHTRRAKNFDCKYQVDAERDDGIIAVIQHLNFRWNSTTRECIDYVQFRRRDGVSSEQICGKLDIEEPPGDSQYDDYSNLAFVDPHGKMDTHIYISRERLKPNQKMNLEIVYTAYRKCTKFNIPCLENNFKYCLPHQYFDDGVVNCPYRGCVDEGNCAKLKTNLHDIEMENCVGYGCQTVDTDSVTSTKVIISAVTSLIVSFVVFIACIWICKKTGKICWSVRCANSTRNTHNNQSSRVIEMQNRPESEVAPATGATPNAPELDKDLPPSYDSLFPTR